MEGGGPRTREERNRGSAALSDIISGIQGGEAEGPGEGAAGRGGVSSSRPQDILAQEQEGRQVGVQCWWIVGWVARVPCPEGSFK